MQKSIEIALANNPRLGIAQAQVGAAQGRLGQQQARRGVGLGLTTNAVRQGPAVDIPRIGSFVPAFRYNAGVGLQQYLYDGGERIARQRQAEWGLAAARDSFSQTREDVVLEVRLAYLEVLRAQRLKEVGEETLKQAQEHLRIAEARFRAGTAARFDTLRSEAEVANAEQTLLADVNLLDLAEAQFNNALGRDLNTPVKLQPLLEPPEVEVTLPQAMDAAHHYRPELLALPKQVGVAQQGLRVARAANAPNFDFSAGYSRFTGTAFSEDFAFNFTVTLNFNLFDSGFNRSLVREAEENVKQAEKLNEQVRQAVALQVRSAYLNLQNARQRRATAAKEVAQASEAARIAQVRYQAGVGTNVEVTDAQVAMTRAQWNATNALYDYYGAIARLEHATGTRVENLKGSGMRDKG